MVGVFKYKWLHKIFDTPEELVCWVKLGSEQAGTFNYVLFGPIFSGFIYFIQSD
jgi:hypothetical protein